MKKNKIKLAIIFGVEFIAVAVVLLLIFFAGKKSYTVTFDLNGGTHLGGDLVQEVMQGGNATPPSTAKEGCYLHSWSASYKQITRDITIRAIWEYETTVGIEYSTDRDGYNSNYCEITGSFSELRGDVYLGAYHDGKKILGIRDNAFKDRDGIEHIYMLDGIISIGNDAFSGCTSLESIVLPNTIAVISDGAFANCSSLKTITLPATLEKIGVGAFSGCTSLEKVIFRSEEREVVVEVEPEEDEQETHSKKSEPPTPVETYEYSPLKSIASEAFAGCTSLVSVTLPPMLVRIGDGAFMGCEALEEISLPATLEQIGMNAFLGCKALSDLTLPDALKSIGDGAFSECEALTEIVIPKSVTAIGLNAFDTEELVIRIFITEADKPEGWIDGWYSADLGIELEWEYVPSAEPDEAESPDDIDGGDHPVE